MRRPVKPFVTEYKAPNRRLNGRNGEDHFSMAGGGDAAPRRSPEAGGHGENAYEAAMKAADALFSPVERSREAEDAPVPERAGEAFGDAEDAPAPAGRILRAIDEPPAPEPIELEEPPRRRGRKPGSKNKPKLVVGAFGPPPPATEQEAEEPEFEEDGPGVTAAPPSSPARASVPYRARNSERFPWVRTKLKPGEQWKRRLPKVCW